MSVAEPVTERFRVPSWAAPEADPAAATPAPGPRRGWAGWSRRWSRAHVGFLLGVLALAGLTAFLRLWHGTSAYELFMDEIQYGDLGNSFAAGRGPELFGEPFFLHPPLFFAVLGGVIGVPVPQMSVDIVLGLRWVNTVFAVVNVLLVIAVTRRVTPRWAALLAGLVYALDPFVIRFDSRLMIEASMMTGILAGVLAALVAVQRPTARGRTAWLVVAGIAFGVALTTKSTSALITTVPLLLMLATSWGLRRREAFGVLAVQAGTYGLYLLWIVLTGRGPAWLAETLSGVARAVGLVKETGFSAEGSPGFLSRVIARVGMFAPSYLLIGVATLYAGYLLVIGWRSLRVAGAGGPAVAGAHAVRGAGDPLGLMTCWLAGVLMALLYTGGLGTIEEQTFYLLAVPSTVVVGLLATQAARWRRGPRAALVVLLVAVLAGSAAIWTTLRTERDDAYRQVLDAFPAVVDPRDRVGLGEVTAQFVLPGYDLQKVESVADARATGTRYVLVSTELTALGLAPLEAPALAELERRFPVVLAADGRTAGELRLYDLARPLDGGPPVVAPAPGPGRP